jgi:hypothetical protein
MLLLLRKKKKEEEKKEYTISIERKAILQTNTNKNPTIEQPTKI